MISYEDTNDQLVEDKNETEQNWKISFKYLVITGHNDATVRFWNEEVIILNLIFSLVYPLVIQLPDHGISSNLQILLRVTFPKFSENFRFL